METKETTEALLAVVHKSSIERFQVRRVIWHGREYADVRLFYAADPTLQEWKPTRKGVCIRLDLLPEILEGLRVLEAEAKTARTLRGLVAEARAAKAQESSDEPRPNGRRPQSITRNEVAELGKRRKGRKP